MRGLVIAYFCGPPAVWQLLFYEQLKRIGATRIGDEIQLSHRFEGTENFMVPAERVRESHKFVVHDLVVGLTLEELDTWTTDSWLTASLVTLP